MFCSKWYTHEHVNRLNQFCLILHIYRRRKNQWRWCRIVQHQTHYFNSTFGWNFWTRTDTTWINIYSVIKLLLQLDNVWHSLNAPVRWLWICHLNFRPNMHCDAYADCCKVTTFLVDFGIHRFHFCHLFNQVPLKIIVSLWLLKIVLWLFCCLLLFIVVCICMCHLCFWGLR